MFFPHLISCKSSSCDVSILGKLAQSAGRCADSILSLGDHRKSGHGITEGSYKNNPGANVAQDHDLPAPCRF
jgi:hypothetical protein